MSVAWLLLLANTQLFVAAGRTRYTFSLQQRQRLRSHAGAPSSDPCVVLQYSKGTVKNNPSKGTPAVHSFGVCCATTNGKQSNQCPNGDYPTESGCACDCAGSLGSNRAARCRLQPELHPRCRTDLLCRQHLLRGPVQAWGSHWQVAVLCEERPDGPQVAVCCAARLFRPPPESIPFASGPFHIIPPSLSYKNLLSGTIKQFCPLDGVRLSRLVPSLEV